MIEGVLTMLEENFQTASDIAYRIISQKILDGEFSPGMKLSRRKMAEVTGVSVIPVIEALKKLKKIIWLNLNLSGALM